MESKEDFAAGIIQLLALWPQASVAISKRFVKERYGIEIDDELILGLRQQLGMKPGEALDLEHEFVCYSTYNTLARYGYRGKTVEQLTISAASEFAEKYGRELSPVLVRAWVDECMKAAEVHSFNPVRIRAMSLEVLEKMRGREYGI